MNDISNLILIGWISHWEILMFAGILLVLFGGAKLPSLMRNMGRSVNEFKAGIREQPQEDPQYVADEANAEKEAVTK